MVKHKFTFLLIPVVLFSVSYSFAKMLETKEPVKSIKERKAESLEDKVQKLAEKLQLTEEQKEMVRKIFTRSKEAIVRVLEDAGRKIEKINSDSDAEINNILTDEQRGKFSNEPKEDETEWLKVYK